MPSCSSGRSPIRRDAATTFPLRFDKFVAASPLLVAAVIEAYWFGAQGLDALSWRHHAVAALWAAFAVTDFFADGHYQPATASPFSSIVGRQRGLARLMDDFELAVSARLQRLYHDHLDW
jgi:hypothetical protein